MRDPVHIHEKNSGITGSSITTQKAGREMDSITGSVAIGIILMLSLIALAARELVMVRGTIFHPNLIRFLNVFVTVMVALFIYVFARIVIEILTA